MPVAGPGSNVVKYEHMCFWCKSLLVTPYYDEIEEHVMRCRENAPDWQRGDLSSYKQYGGPEPCASEQDRNDARRRASEQAEAWAVGSY